MSMDLLLKISQNSKTGYSKRYLFKVDFQDFMASTNISGLTNAHHAKTGFRKFLWLVIFTGFFIL